jgi:branched-chain amino acid transport system permease protein
VNTTLIFVQALNGLQFGILLFLIAAGLTLVFGVMDFINLAHGVQYMVGAYLGATLAAWTGSFWWGLLLTLPATLGFGLLLEFLVFRHFYDRDHLSQVLATFGVILFLNEGMRVLFGTAPLQMPMPDLLSGGITVMDGLLYPTYRIAILAVGLAIAGLLWFLVERTRAGMLVRAGPATRRWSARSASISGGSSCWSSASAPCWRASRARWPRPSSRWSRGWATRR